METKRQKIKIERKKEKKNNKIKKMKEWVIYQCINIRLPKLGNVVRQN